MDLEHGSGPVMTDLWKLSNGNQVIQHNQELHVPESGQLCWSKMTIVLHLKCTFARSKLFSCSIKYVTQFTSVTVSHLYIILICKLWSEFQAIMKNWFSYICLLYIKHNKYLWSCLTVVLKWSNFKLLAKNIYGLYFRSQFQTIIKMWLCTHINKLSIITIILVWLNSWLPIWSHLAQLAVWCSDDRNVLVDI